MPVLYPCDSLSLLEICFIVAGKDIYRKMKPSAFNFKKIAAVSVGLLVLAQLIRVDKTPPEAQGEIPAPPEVRQILTRACYDCHSNQTTWPWYTNVAPVSWWISNHVHEGRRHLDFTQWDTYPAKRRKKKMEETRELVEKGEMPMPSYLWVHDEAKLSEQDKKTLIDWAKGLEDSAAAEQAKEASGAASK